MLLLVEVPPLITVVEVDTKPSLPCASEDAEEVLFFTEAATAADGPTLLAFPLNPPLGSITFGLGLRNPCGDCPGTPNELV